MRQFLTFGIVAIMAMPSLVLADTFTQSLSLGARSPEVTALQQILITSGYLKTPATGYFGQLTKNALISFQKAHGLAPVGSLGPKTRSLLNAQTSQANSTLIQTTVSTSSSLQATATPTTSPTSPVTSSSTNATSSSVLTIAMIAPSATLPANTIDTTLVIGTNKSATCRYGTLANMEYKSMLSFGQTAVTTHSHLFSGLVKGGWYIYYVKCEDSATLVISPETTVSFKVAAN
jgi:hypothetical protein